MLNSLHVRGLGKIGLSASRVAVNTLVCLLRTAVFLAAGLSAVGSVGRASEPPDPCMAKPASWDAGVHVSSIVPTSIYDGTVEAVQVSGNKLTATWTIRLCPLASTRSIPAGLTVGAFMPFSTSTLLRAQLTAPPESAGTYRIVLVDTSGNVFDPKTTLTISSTGDTRYVACAAPSNRGKPTNDLACSFVPIPYDTELDVFGKGVANHFIAVEVKVRNKNSDLEYLLQDIRIGRPDFVVSSFDKKIPRGVAEKAEQFSARAIVFRLTAATASVLTGIAGFAGSDVLQEAANIYAGPAQTGLQSSIPNLSSAELARLDDLGFSVVTTVIPKNSAVDVVAFIPSETLPVAEHASSRWIKSGVSWLRPQPNAFSTYKGNDLKELFSSFTVSVAGSHVQEVNPSQPTLKMVLSGLPLNVSDMAIKDSILMVQGTALQSVKQVQLKSTTLSPSATITGTIQAISGENSVDSSVANISLPKNTYAPDTYEIHFVLADGSDVDTKQTAVVH